MNASLLQPQYDAEAKLKQVEAERDRYAAHLKLIAHHHEVERDHATDNQMADYHEKRRNVAMFPFVCPEALGMRPLPYGAV